MSHDVIDMKEVLDRVQDDRELLMELLQIFTQDYEEKDKILKDAIGKKDFEQVKNIAHSIKGASGNIAAKQLHASFLQLEQMARAQDFSRAAEVLSAVDQQFAEFKIFVSQLKK